MNSLSNFKISPRTSLGLLLLAIIILTGFTFFVSPQSTLDASYYHIMVNQLLSGKGFTEPVIWHNLNSYNSLEHPMDYWMPLGIGLYALARLGFGISGEVWLNIFIWAILATLIFHEVYRFSQSFFCAGVAFATHIFCGRILFFLLTTDNIAFSALLGYFFMKSLASDDTSWQKTAVCGGLLTLLRIEGILFAAIGALVEFNKSKKLKTLLLYCCLVMVILSPWVARNMFVLGKPWTTNTRALFMQNYNDFFSDKFSGTLEYYLSIGGKEILRQKIWGLWVSFMNLVLVPMQFLFFPVILSGLVVSWRRSADYFTFLLVFFWLLCGLVFTNQAEFGTAMHISAYFYPFYAIYLGKGLFALCEKLKNRKGLYQFSGAMIVATSLLMTLLFINHFRSIYEKRNSPYIELFKQFKSQPEDKIASARPIYINYLTGCPGVLASNLTSRDPATIADAYECNLIVLDKRELHSSSPDAIKWELIADKPVLKLFKRCTHL